MSRIFTLFFLIFSSFLWGQNSQQKTLELRKVKIQKEIKANEQKLEKIKANEKKTLNVIVLKNNGIQLKENLISTTEKQTKVISTKISSKQDEIKKLSGELFSLKKDYSKMIVQSYKSRSPESKIMFLLSAESFLQAYKRLQYMKQYASFRKKQGEEIQRKSQALNHTIVDLDFQKNQKELLIEENEKEKLSLEQEKKEQEKLVESLKKEKKQIANQISQKQKESKAIEKKIDLLIREAIAAANRRAEKLAKEKREKEERQRKLAQKNKLNQKTKTPDSPKNKAPKTEISTAKMELTPELKLNSDSFKNNKGKLPWPVENGFISLGFGDQPHAVFKTLMIHNSGLEITTNSNNARAVFGGEVISIMVLSPVNKAVMIQHGDFFTIYQNLSSVNVSKGTVVSVKETIGKIKTNSSGKNILKFMITQNTNYIDPKFWLSPK